MEKRTRWTVQTSKVIPTQVRDSEFAEILASLGELIYSELSSQPDSLKSKDLLSQPAGFEASQNLEEVCL